MVSIAIDGPSAAGKSTIAKLAAKELSFMYVDTGAMYRAIALFAIRNNIDAKDEKQICSLLSKINIGINFINREQVIFLNGENVNSEIRTHAVSMKTSDISSIAGVRKFLLQKQRDLANKNNVIMDGRDIATVVLPNADVKIFLTASVEARARRRFDEIKKNNCHLSFEEIYMDIKKRDQQDSNRKIAPLTMSSDATLIDTSDINLQEAVKLVVDTIKFQLSERGFHI